MSKEILTLNSQTVIGMVHCLPLPTTAGFDGDYQRIIDRAVQDAVTLEKAGVDAVIVENMGDTPFSAFLNKAQVAALTAAAYAVKQAVQIPVGLDAAFNDCEADIAIAAMVGASLSEFQYLWIQYCLQMELFSHVQRNVWNIAR